MGGCPGGISTGTSWATSGLLVGLVVPKRHTNWPTLCLPSRAGDPQRQRLPRPGDHPAHCGRPQSPGGQWRGYPQCSLGGGRTPQCSGRLYGEHPNISFTPSLPALLAPALSLAGPPTGQQNLPPVCTPSTVGLESICETPLPTTPGPQFGMRAASVHLALSSLLLQVVTADVLQEARILVLHMVRADNLSLLCWILRLWDLRLACLGRGGFLAPTREWGACTCFQGSCLGPLLRPKEPPTPKHMGDSEAGQVRKGAKAQLEIIAEW